MKKGLFIHKHICNICVWFLILVCAGFVATASDVSVLQGQYYTGTTFNVGTYIFNFTIYDALTGGSACYSNVSNLTTNDFGLWKIELSGISGNCNNVSKDYFVNINIEGVDQTPRRRLTNFDFMRKNVAEESSGNLTLSGNVFTRFLGELTNRVMEFFVEDIEFNGTISGSGNLNITGNIETSNNVTADYYLGDGSLLSNLPAGGNESWNQTLADTLYSPVNYGDDWNKTYADTLYADISVVSNPFDQTLNTTDGVTFVKANISGNLTVGGALIYINGGDMIFKI